MRRTWNWSSKSIALALGSTVGLVGALTGAFVPPRALALFAPPSASASPSHPPTPYVPSGARKVPPTSTALDLTELRMFSPDDGWAISEKDDSRSLVRIRHGGRSLGGVGPQQVVDVSFVDPMTAFVTTAGVGVGSIVVHRTTDGGVTFTATQIDAATSSVRSNGVAFRDALRGAVVISVDAGPGSASVGVWLTRDGGRTWIRDGRHSYDWTKPVGANVWVEEEDGTMLGWNGVALAPIRGLDGCQVEVGFAGTPRPDVLRAACETGERFFVSHDGGTSWTEAGGRAMQGDYVFADAAHGYLWGDPERDPRSGLYATSDSGRTWTPIAEGGDELALDALPLTKDDVLVVMRDTRPASGLERLWISRDHGKLVPTSVGTDVSAEHLVVSVVDPMHVVVVTHGSLGSRIFASNDGARTFVQRFAE